MEKFRSVQEWIADVEWVGVMGDDDDIVLLLGDDEGLNAFRVPIGQIRFLYELLGEFHG